MSNSVKDRLPDPVESEIIEEMEKKGYSLDIVNKYGDNLLHVSTANGCYTVIKEILKKHDSREFDLQNDCGWTPLMQAIRNGNVESVKLLLANGCDPEQSSHQGVAAITLAVAISREMFELIHEACPNALEKSKNDNINPLCVAAMKNDKELFFRLLELGLQISDASDYTLLMMAQSTEPEIAELSETRNEDMKYWNEEPSFDDYIVPQMSSTLQDIEHLAAINDLENLKVPYISVICPPRENGDFLKRRNSAPMTFRFGSEGANSFISPKLEYTRESIFAKSPNMCFQKRESTGDSGVETGLEKNYDQMNNNNQEELSVNQKKSMESFGVNRTLNLIIPKIDFYDLDFENPHNELDGVARQISDEKSIAEILLEHNMNINEVDVHLLKVAHLLKSFGLPSFIPIFIKEEVDMDVILDLTDRDLQEIGIAEKSDRAIVQSFVDYLNGKNCYYLDEQKKRRTCTNWVTTESEL